MIAKGTPHNNGARLARYMITGKAGERAELWELRGFASPEIVDAFRTIHVIAEATKAQDLFFHVQVRNPEGETLNRHQWEATSNRIERMLGLTGQPRAIAFHIDRATGHEHVHIAWSRIDEEALTAKPLPFYKERLKKISRELEMEFGLTVVPSERDSSIKYAPTRDQEEQARRLGVNIHDARESIRECLNRSDCGGSFEAALAQEGLVLAQGERRDFVVIDQAGGLHALGKRITGLSAAQLRERLADLTREHLPTVEQAQGFVRERARSHGNQKTEPLWDRDNDEIAWQNAVTAAAIEKENAAREFAEKRSNGRQEKEQEKPTRPEPVELGWTAAQMRLARSFTDSPQAFADALEDRGLILVRINADDLPKLAELENRAEQASICTAHSRCKETSLRPLFREGDLAVVNQGAEVVGLTPRNTGLDCDALTDFLKDLDQAAMPSVTEAWAVLKNLQPHHREEALAHEPEKHSPLNAPEDTPMETLPRYSFEDAAGVAIYDNRPLNAPEEDKRKFSAGYKDSTEAARIWEAYNRNRHDPNAFAAALDEQGILLVAVTKEEADRSHRETAFAKEIGNFASTYREGEIVAMGASARVHKLNERTTGQKRVEVEQFLTKLDRSGLQGIEATTQIMHKRADARESYAQLMGIVNPVQPVPRRRFTNEGIAQAALGKAVRTGDKTLSFTGAVLRSTLAPEVIIPAARAAGAVGKTLDSVASVFESLPAPILTPEQKRQGEIGTWEDQDETEEASNFSNRMSEVAQQRLQEEKERTRQTERQRSQDHDRDR